MKNKIYQPTNNGNSRPYNSETKGGDTVLEPHTPIIARPLEVIVYNNFDKAMKHFRSLVQKERTVSTYKEKQRYEKPSDKKRRKRQENQRKRLELQGLDDFSTKKRKKVKSKDKETSQSEPTKQ